MTGRTTLGAETLQRDASALFSFIDTICSQGTAFGDAPTYLQPSVKFFEYITQLGEATKAYLNVFPAKAPKDARLYQGYRQKLETIRSCWEDFHMYIKPARDADTLNIPYSLIEALTKRLNLIRGFERTAFAIFHFAELNYLEVPLSLITRTTERLKRVIPDPPVFPADTGLIGIPYSQSSSLYLNSIVAHEMGHFVFEKLDLKSKIYPDIGKNLETVLGPDLGKADPDNLEWSKDRISSWAEELFCDLFAVWLIGPCCTFTDIELLGLTTILDPAAASGFTPTDGSIIFSRSHPADLFRVKQQVAMLQKLGWWVHIDTIKSHYVDVLRSAITVDDRIFGFPTTEQQYSSETLMAFLRLSPLVSDILSDVMKTTDGKVLDCGVSGFAKFGDLVGEYLKRAVVPSTVFDQKDHWYPDPLTLLNASMRFYLESLEDMMNGVSNQKTFLSGHRSKWIKRLESLTAKAIEDHQLLVGEKGAIASNGLFKRPDRGSFES